MSNESHHLFVKSVIFLNLLLVGDCLVFFLLVVNFFLLLSWSEKKNNNKRTIIRCYCNIVDKKWYLFKDRLKQYEKNKTEKQYANMQAYSLVHALCWFFSCFEALLGPLSSKFISGTYNTTILIKRSMIRKHIILLEWITFICTVTIMVCSRFFHPCNVGLHNNFVIYNWTRIVLTNNTPCCLLYTSWSSPRLIDVFRRIFL